MADYRVTMALIWSVFDEFMATDASGFTEAAVPEIGSTHPGSKHWVSNYFLNSVFRGQYGSPTRELVAVLLRRVTIAFEEYDLAKARTDEFVQRRLDGQQPMRVYLSALHHWEQCVAAAWQAVAAWTKLTGEQAFEPDADSPSAEERLNHLYNGSKHTDSKIVTPGQMPESGPLAVWLTNEGLRSVEHLLTWSELAEVLDELAKAADLLQDPKALTGTE